MPWLTPRLCLRYERFEKLSKLTNEPREKTLVGTGDGSTTVFTTPFFGGTAPTLYLDGVAAAPTLAQTGTNERWKATFAPPPGSGVRIEATSADGVNADVLEQKLLAAQADLRGYIQAGGWGAPADDATVLEPLLRWSWDIGAYFLASDARRAGLLEAYPGVADRYADLTGLGPASVGRPAASQPVLRDVAKGRYSLRGVLARASVSATDPYITDAFGSEGDLLFGPPS